jgi:hypothetical protein
MAQTLTLESTVIQRETHRTADLLFVPIDSLELAGVRTPDDVEEFLGVRPGVSVTNGEELQDLLFASLAGRVYPFDQGSFDRWRPQRIASAGSADAVFAEQLAMNDLVPVSSSPIRGVSLTTVVTQEVAWTISGADMLFHDPLQGLGLLALRDWAYRCRSLARREGDACGRGQVPTPRATGTPSRLDAP